MSLIAYILSSILLSWLGVGLYWILRKLGAPLSARRGLLWMVVFFSLTLPLLPSYRDITTPAPTNVASVSTSVHDFCHCENPGAGEVIHYQTSRLNDVLLQYRPWIWGSFALILAFILLRFAVSIGKLLFLTRRHAAESILVDGQKVRLVRDFPGVQAGALRLGGRFVFWQSGLDLLSSEEKRAILLHELSHIRQGNTVERLILGLAQSVWFINPAYYFISKELIFISEFTADSFVVRRTQQAKEYARLLLKMKSQPELHMVSLFKGGELKARVSAVLKPEQHNPRLIGWALTIGFSSIFSLELAAETVIDHQIKEIAVYEFLTEANHQTGKDAFCKKCTYEMVESCY